MKFRIKKYAEGWVVEIQKQGWFSKYWTHFISVSGISSVPWYFSSREFAETAMIKKIKWETIENGDNN